jgi:hypothetical protein
MAMLFCFFMGIANFAMHRAVLESRHPFVEDTKLYFGQHIGRNTSYVLEYLVLTAAMLFAFDGSIFALALYIGYTSMNAIAAYMLTNGRV